MYQPEARLTYLRKLARYASHVLSPNWSLSALHMFNFNALAKICWILQDHTCRFLELLIFSLSDYTVHLSLCSYVEWIMVRCCMRHISPALHGIQSRMYSAVKNLNFTEYDFAPPPPEIQKYMIERPVCSFKKYRKVNYHLWDSHFAFLSFVLI